LFPENGPGQLKRWQSSRWNPNSKPAVYFTPNFVDKELWRQLKEKHPKATLLSDSEAWKAHFCISAKAARQWDCLFLEFDEGSREDQLAALIALEKETGLFPNLIVDSGDCRPETLASLNLSKDDVQEGKGLHCFFVLPESVSLKEGKQLQLALIAASKGADPACKDVLRTFRKGGEVARYRGKVRVQTILHFNSEKTSLDTYRETLTKPVVQFQVKSQAEQRLQSIHHLASTRKDLRTLMDPETGQSMYEIGQALAPGQWENLPGRSATHPGKNASIGKLDNGQLLYHEFSTKARYPNIWHDHFSDLSLSPHHTFVDKEDFRLWVESKADEVLKEGFHAFDLPTGWGKTHLFAALAEYGSVLTVAPLRSLVADMARRFTTTSYEDLPGTLKNESRVSVCIPSLERTFLGRWDVVILDEWTEILGMLDSGLIKNPLSVMEAIRYVCQNARLVMVADAYLDQYSLDSLAEITGCDASKIQVYSAVGGARPRKGQTLYHHSTLGSIRRELFNAIKAGQRVYVSCTIKKEVKKLEKRIRKECNQKKRIRILTIHADKKADLSNVNEDWSQYQVVIVSPSVCTGVSFDLEHFDRGFLFGQQHNEHGQRIVTDSILFQMLARVRNYRSQRVDAYITECTDSDVIVCPEIQRLDMVCADKNTRDGLKQLLNENFQPPASLESSVIAKVRTTKQLRTVYLRQRFLSQWESDGGSLRHVGKLSKSQAKKESEANKKAQAEVRLEKNQAVVDAPQVESWEAEYLERKQVKTSEEKQKLTRYQIAEDRPGFNEWSTEEQLAAVDTYEKDSKGASALLRAKQWILTQQGITTASEDLHKEDLERARNGGLCVQHEGQRRGTHNKALELLPFNCSLESLLNGEELQWFKDDLANSNTSEELSWGAAVQRLLSDVPFSVTTGLHRGQVQKDNGSRLLSSLLESYGYTIERTRRRIRTEDGTRKQVYYMVARPGVGHAIYQRRAECAPKR
jgi:hypothetical protein